MKHVLNCIIPKNLWRLGSSSYWGRYNRDWHVLARTISSRRAQSRRVPINYRDRYRGQCCFMVGNGRSLQKTDLSLLKDEFTFGLNRIYLLFPELGYTTTFLVSVNDLVLDQCSAEIQAFEMPKFITWRARFCQSSDSYTIFVDTDYTSPEKFSTHAIGCVFEGFTVTYGALQLAYPMGFAKVILVGVDHNFIITGPANTEVVPNGDDPNHFTPGYFGKGFRRQMPELEGSERAYSLVKRVYEKAGRRIMDATPDGKLSVFKKVLYSSLFSST